jgi:2-methylcitrate dehydratase PrpD
MDAIRPLVDFVAGTRFRDLPAEVVALARQSLLDNLGNICAGTVADGCDKVAAMVMDWNGKPEARLIGWGARAPVPDAVWLNSVQSRALELDDVHEPGLMHATSGSVPVALGVTELVPGTSGRELLAAVAVGMELSCRLAMAPEVSSAISGMSFTFQATTFGAAATAGRLLSLDPERLVHSMGIAYSQAAGNQQTLREGALMTRVQQGLSARAGTLAALLARAGITGPQEVLEGRFGYMNVYHAGRYDRGALVDGLGPHWEILRISTKPYPCCRFIHSTVKALVDLMATRSVDPDAVVAVEARIDNREHFNLVCEPLETKRRPSDVAEAQFSVPYVVATCLRRGGIGLGDFTPTAIRDPATLALAARVTPTIDPAAEGPARAGYPPAYVRIDLASGETLVATAPATAPGHPDNPLNESERLKKFRDCMAFARLPLPSDRVERLIECIERIEDTGADALLRLLD